MPIARAVVFAGAVMSIAAHAQANDDNAELAKKLSNPVAAMISVPFQFNYDQNMGPLFFSPAKPTGSGIIWGVGPAFLIPTATDDLLGSKRWGLGPTAIVLKQDHAWTYGFLFNHIWSIAKVGNDKTHSDISSTFLQPFLSYNTPTAWTYGLNAESSYDWKTHQWAVPVNATIGKLVRIGGHPVSFTGGVRYWAQHTDAGQKGWGFRFVVTLLVPEKR
jgi:hypothetical protein